MRGRRFTPGWTPASCERCRRITSVSARHHAIARSTSHTHRSGESIRAEDAARIVSLIAARGTRPPQVQVVISDGLNANALNENLPAVLPQLRHELAAAGLHVAEVDVVIQNGRVRAGYHVGALVDADAVVHFIGERPGTGLDTLSAYLTYGRDPAGRSRWSPGLDHASTTAVCGIHRARESAVGSRRGNCPIAPANPRKQAFRHQLAWVRRAILKTALTRRFVQYQAGGLMLLDGGAEASCVHVWIAVPKRGES